MDDALLAQLPQLRVLGKYGVGLNNLDFEAMSRLGVRLGWRPGVNTQSVADRAIALMIITLQKLQLANDEVRAGGWRQIAGAELNGRTVGIVGLGHVGKGVALLSQAFGCTAIVRMDDELVLRAASSKPASKRCSPEQTSSRYTCRSSATRATSSAPSGSRSPSPVWCSSTQRGAGSSTKVPCTRCLSPTGLPQTRSACCQRAPPADSPLLRHPRCFATPHVGGSSKEAILAMRRAAIDGLDRSVDAAIFID